MYIYVTADMTTSICQLGTATAGVVAYAMVRATRRAAAAPRPGAAGSDAPGRPPARRPATSTTTTTGPSREASTSATAGAAGGCSSCCGGCGGCVRSPPARQWHGLVEQQARSQTNPGLARRRFFLASVDDDSRIATMVHELVGSCGCPCA
jgi:hypothetical protein